MLCVSAFRGWKGREEKKTKASCSAQSGNWKKLTLKQKFIFYFVSFDPLFMSNKYMIHLSHISHVFLKSNTINS